MAVKQYPIYDFKSGLQLQKDPWLLPNDAFTTLDNLRVFRGVLEKRAGYSIFESLSTDPIAGIYKYVKDDGTRELVFWDIAKFYVYDSATGSSSAVTGVSDFTGNDDSTFWAQNWKDNLFFVNNQDRLTRYNGTALSYLDVDIDGDAVNDLTTCKLIFIYHGRMVLFNTQENGTRFPQRARWCRVDDYTDWENDEYLDMPSSDEIIGADFVRDTLYVFTDSSLWAFRYTANEVLPFRWERVSSVEGTIAQHSLATFSNNIYTSNGQRLVVTDGIDIENFDVNVPDFMDTVAPERAQYMYSLVTKEFRNILWGYTSINSEANDKIAAYNVDDKSWQIYDAPAKVFGLGKVYDDPTMDDVDLTFDEIEQTFDTKATQAGFPLSLFGDYDGNIYKLDESGSDAGTDISIEAKSVDINPFRLNGQGCLFHYMDIMVDVDADATFDVSLYVNEDSQPYKVQTIDCTGQGTTEWHRVYADAVSNSHSFKITNSGSNDLFRIHAFILYLEPSGVIV